MTRPVSILLLLLLCTAGADAVRAQTASDTEAASSRSTVLAQGLIRADVRERVERAREQILAMDLDSVSKTLTAVGATIDERALVGWTRELAHLLELLVADESSDYEAFLDRNDALYEQLDQVPGTAWRHWLMGEISLQRTWARSKQGQTVRAAWAARRALEHLERARTLDPDFTEPLKGLGLLHMGIGALPDRFRRVLGWFGITGTLEEGVSELLEARETSLWNGLEASVLLATIDKFGFPSPVRATKVYEQLWSSYPESPLIALSYADVLIRERRPEQALSVLDAAKDPAGRVHYLTWYRGEALFHLGRCNEAEAAFAAYEHIHAGASLKLNGRLLAGQCAELAGRREEAVSWYARIVGERGFAEEQAAMRKAARLMAHPMTEEEKRLLQAWGAFNSGRDDIALNRFEALRGRTATPGEIRAEAAYGVARVFHEKGDTARALEAYRATLDEQADPLAKWHGFARMHLITLYLQNGDITAARRVLEELEGMESAYDFRSSVENRIRFLPWP